MGSLTHSRGSTYLDGAPTVPFEGPPVGVADLNQNPPDGNTERPNSPPTRSSSLTTAIASSIIWK